MLKAGHRVIGIPKEVKVHENRVGLPPAGVHALTERGHKVLVEANAGVGSGFPDSEYRNVGANIVGKAADVFSAADMIVKVKEPIGQERELLRHGQILFTYLHLSADKNLTEALVMCGVTAIAYETVELSDGSLPLLAPMSEVAGKLAAEVGAYYLHKTNGGIGKLMGGVTGVAPANVLILGGGVASLCAPKVATGMGAHVVVLERAVERMRHINKIMPQVSCLYSTPHALRELLPSTDVLIGAVLLHGARAPRIVARSDIQCMPKGAVVVDISIDQGGCVETARPTTHADPVYEEEGVIHYCVTNMPGIVPRTSTLALSNATLPYVLNLADNGFDAVHRDEALARGVNVHEGRVLCSAVAKACGYDAGTL